MKTNELMIGDWVQKLEVGGHYRKCRIKAIFDDGVVDCVTSDGEVHTLSVNGIEPIPLTADILEWDGFVRDDKHEYSVTGSNYNYLKVRCYADTYFEIGNAFDEEGELQAFADIQYVHELQHALKLCGIDKEIEL